jgi:hypothetical protein
MEGPAKINVEKTIRIAGSELQFLEGLLTAC